jgi:hypothetical protein
VTRDGAKHFAPLYLQVITNMCFRFLFNLWCISSHAMTNPTAFSSACSPSTRIIELRQSSRATQPSYHGHVLFKTERFRLKRLEELQNASFVEGCFSLCTIRRNDTN